MHGNRHRFSWALAGSFWPGAAYSSCCSTSRATVPIWPAIPVSIRYCSGASSRSFTTPRWTVGIRPERRWRYLYVPLAVAALLLSFLFRNGVFRDTVRYSLQGLALMPIFIAAIRFPHWLPFRVLNTRPMELIGRLSYSLYLLHYGALEFVWRHLPTIGAVAQGLSAFGLSVALAAAIYVFIERPCANLRRRLTDYACANVRSRSQQRLSHVGPAK